jgi:5-(carboxyamino)imidazole ribonucleotide synthase
MDQPLAPGNVVGILGGGQLGRMMAHAAHRLGYKTHIFTTKRGSATQVSSRKTIASYDDPEALAAFADGVDVVTCEFENVPAQTIAALAERVPVHPGARALATCQDRIAEKSFLALDVEVPTADWGPAHGPDDVAALVAHFGRRCVLKTARFGYDGKGQTTLGPDDSAEEAWARISGGKPGVTAIVEAFVDFSYEASVVLARNTRGDIAAFDLVENKHRNHILHQTIAPAHASDAVRAEADRIARSIVESLDYVGVMGVELFITPDDRVLVNEMAPRPHNSGHWTMDGTVTSQFEQAIRAVTGHALGSTERLADAVMTNLLGEDVHQVAELLSDPHARLHLYGKTLVKPGRKMGHVTRLIRG